jgi:hypothetical protein
MTLTPDTLAQIVADAAAHSKATDPDCNAEDSCGTCRIIVTRLAAIERIVNGACATCKGHGKVREQDPDELILTCWKCGGTGMAASPAPAPLADAERAELATFRALRDEAASRIRLAGTDGVSDSRALRMYASLARVGKGE